MFVNKMMGMRQYAPKLYRSYPLQLQYSFKLNKNLRCCKCIWCSRQRDYEKKVCSYGGYHIECI